MTDRYTGPVSQDAANQQPVYGPGAVTGNGPPSPEMSGDRLEQTRQMLSRWGEEVGRLARRSQYAPVLPQGANSDTPDHPIGPGGIVSAPAAQRAAAATGVPERFISSLTTQESGGDASAQAPTSTAAGHGQFINQTWFNMMAQNAERYGHPEIAGAFTRGADGNYRPSAEMREPILDLRNDPTWSALMIGESARENDLALRRSLGRDLSQGDVYVAHWLGPREATTFLQAYDRASRSGSGRGPIAKDVVSSQAYQNNMPVFWTPDARFHVADGKFVHDGGGRLRTVTEVYGAQTARFGARTPFVLQDRATP